MKYLILLLVLLLNQLALKAQQQKACTCLQDFAHELEQIDERKVENLTEHIDETFQQLKRDNPEFRTCVDFYNLYYGLWTIGKLRIFMGLNNCVISDRAREMLEQGPIIYEMAFKLEQAIKAQHESTEYQRFTDTAVISSASTRSRAFLKASFSQDTNAYLSFLPSWYIRFFGKEKLAQTLMQENELPDSVDFQVDVKATKPTESLLQKDNVLMSLFGHEVEFKVNDTSVHKQMNVLAISEDLGESWHYLNVINKKVSPYWVLNPVIDPIALEDKFNAEGAAKYAAKNGKELGAHFCECVKDVDPDDFMKVMKCSGILIHHPLWKEFSANVHHETYSYVKQNCSAFKDAFIFKALNMDD